MELLGEHRPWGPFRGGKYSIFEAGTRVPMIVSWPAQVKPGVSDALVSQIDLYASMASLISFKFLAKEMPEKKGAYLLYFTISSLVFLVLLMSLSYLLNVM